jgi:MFS family permease
MGPAGWVSQNRTLDDSSRTRPDDRTGPLFWRLWTAAACIYLSEGIRLAAFPLLAAAFTKSPFDVALVSGVQSLAWLFFGLQAGALVDRFAPQWLMMFAGVTRAIVLAVLVIAITLGIHSVAILVAAAFLIGTSNTLDVAALSLLPMLVPAPALERATSRLVTADVTFYEFLGPLIGGTLFALSHWLPVGADFAMQIAVVACVLSLPNTRTPRAKSVAEPRVTMRSEIASCIRWLAAQRSLLIIAISGPLVTFSNAAWMAVLVLYSERALRLPSSAYGLLIAAGALGGLCGATAAGRLANRFPPRATLMVSALLTAVPPLLLAVFRNPLLSGALMAMASGGLACWSVISIAARQRHAPPEMLGRVNALLRFGLFGGAGIGALAGGWLATAMTITAPFVMAGLVGVLPVGMLLFGL